MVKHLDIELTLFSIRVRSLLRKVESNSRDSQKQIIKTNSYVYSLFLNHLRYFIAQTGCVNKFERMCMAILRGPCRFDILLLLPNMIL